MFGEIARRKENLVLIIPILVLVIAFIWLAMPSSPPQANPDPHQLTIKYDDQDRLVFFDANGQRVEPVKLDENDPIGDLIKKKGPFKEVHGIPAAIFNLRKNPSCKPTIIYGNTCVAPHRYCCN